MKKWLSLAVCVALALGLFSAVNASGRLDNIINASDVEQATGLKGLRQVPRAKPVDGITENKFLTGDINFVSSNNQPVIEVQFRPSFAFEQFKGDSGFFKTSVPGLGDEAYTGPSFDPQTTVSFLKGRYYVAVATHIDPKDKSRTVLPIEKVIAVAKTIASRMQ